MDRVPLAVLISVREFWLYKIFKEKIKKYEVRKNVPKQLNNDEGYMVYAYESGRNGRHGIVGRFFSPYAVGYNNAFYPINKGRMNKGCVAAMVVEESCVPPADLIEYAGDGGLWFWKINDPNEFSSVIPLSVLGMSRPPQSWCYLTREQVDFIERVSTNG